jgi:hypothetical protein
MKVRNGFVSNSSSSSFIIPKDKLTNEQILSIHNHTIEANKHAEYYDFGCVDDSWYIKENDFYIMGDCYMDNFSMATFLIDYLKIDRSIIKWEDY